jgi:hypothetical protein
MEFLILRRLVVLVAVLHIVHLDHFQLQAERQHLHLYKDILEAQCLDHMVLHFLELVEAVLVLLVVVPVLLFGVKVAMVKELLLPVHSIP